jgi:hypothetical protein
MVAVEPTMAVQTSIATDDGRSAVRKRARAATLSAMLSCAEARAVCGVARALCAESSELVGESRVLCWRAAGIREAGEAAAAASR